MLPHIPRPDQQQSGPMTQMSWPSISRALTVMWTMLPSSAASSNPSWTLTASVGWPWERTFLGSCSWARGPFSNVLTCFFLLLSEFVFSPDRALARPCFQATFPTIQWTTLGLPLIALMSLTITGALSSAFFLFETLNFPTLPHQTSYPSYLSAPSFSLVRSFTLGWQRAQSTTVVVGPGTEYSPVLTFPLTDKAVCFLEIQPPWGSRDTRRMWPGYMEDYHKNWPQHFQLESCFPLKHH